MSKISRKEVITLFSYTRAKVISEINNLKDVTLYMI